MSSFESPRNCQTMFSPSRLKTLHPLQVFSVKPPSSSLSFTKFKSLMNTIIVSHMCRIIRALSKVKTIILGILKNNQAIHNKKQRIILGSFRLHYNWCSSKSSHVLPVPARVFDGLPSGHSGHDSSWSSAISETEKQGLDISHDDSEELAGYLQWLEEKVQDKGTNNEEIKEDIDMLAEMFIASCHEKFRLEKQESDRRFQEMLARSM
ncbi:uncharacterized protein LOC114763247 [Neltuma alba]|uniref:uncharacterized protein LOC114763247 n=1 Tax=Neltuma alba TaxID=207710 RepID=UPI0010A521B7|nr:uncharacterized protein LOC114763247 [Prosopis alba]